MFNILRWIKAVIHTLEYREKIEGNFSSYEYRISTLEKRVDPRIGLSELRKDLSRVPVVWGEASKLHISPKAAVSSAFFNTNSGDIYIDDYTFTGSNVSILTGSHDMELVGFLRRDCEIKEGNDIRIGKGVWIASNSTIIGPCVIGDNSVIAAGAVVTPGTIIPNGYLYGGIPARAIREINLEDRSDFQGIKHKEALNREKGVLFCDGWSEKKYIKIEDVIYEFHEMIEREATIFSDKEAVRLFYMVGQCLKEPVVLNINGTDYQLDSEYGEIKVCVAGEIRLSKKDNYPISLSYHFFK